MYEPDIQETRPGRYCDGLTPRYLACRLLLRGTVLAVILPGQPALVFDISNLVATAAYQRSRPLALRPLTSEKARILVEDKPLAEAIAALLAAAKADTEAVPHRGRKLELAGGIFAAFVILAWMFDAFLPQQLATMIPLKWRQFVGASKEQNFANLGKKCNSPSAAAAVVKILGTLSHGDAQMPAVEVHIYDLPFVNAFALPGGLIIMSQKLINEAARPEEVAGVLAHEIGHVIHADPEVHMIRDLTTQIFFDAFGSSRSGGTATMIEEFRQSRSAEESADAYARQLMLGAAIDPTGLRDMFNRLLKREGSIKGAMGSIFSTHPGTETRIEKIGPLPAGVKPRQVLSDADWLALRKACTKLRRPPPKASLRRRLLHR